MITNNSITPQHSDKTKIFDILSIISHQNAEVMILDNPIEYLADLVAVHIRDGNHCLTEESIAQIIADDKHVLKFTPGLPKLVIGFLVATKALNEVTIQSAKYYYWTGCNTYPRLWNATGLSFLLSIPWWQYKVVTRFYKYFFSERIACWIGQKPCPLWLELSKAYKIPMDNINAILWAYTEAEMLAEESVDDSGIKYLWPCIDTDMNKLSPKMLILNLFLRNQLTIVSEEREIN